MPKLDSKTISIFCKNLAMMLEAGISPDEGAALLLDDVSERKEELYTACLREITKRTMNGESFAEAIENCDLFPGYAVNLIKTGEQSGRLEKVLSSLSNYYERRNSLTEQIKTAVLYPVILLGLMCIVLLIMVMFVLPVFVDVYENISGSLAASSFGFISVSRVIGKISVTFTLIICACVIFSVLLSRSKKGQEKLSNMSESLPVIKKISFKLAVAQFTDILSTLYSSGVHADTALEETLPIVKNRSLRTKLEAAYKEMLDGADLSAALSNIKIYEPLYARMMISATRSGNLEKNLHELAIKTEQDAEDEIARLISLIEPILTGSLTIIVGVTLLSIMLPLIGILSSM